MNMKLPKQLTQYFSFTQVSHATKLVVKSLCMCVCDLFCSHRAFEHMLISMQIHNNEIKHMVFFVSKFAYN